MTYDPDIHHRQSLRWDKHNYSSPGFYYVTICIQEHRCLLGEVRSGVMNLNDAGEMVDAAWLRIPGEFPAIQLDEHSTMPNHFHGIIQIVGVPLVGTVGVADQREYFEPQHSCLDGGFSVCHT